MTRTLSELQTEAYATARDKGWHNNPLRGYVVGHTLGIPRSGSPVFVVVEGPKAGMFCDSPMQYSVAESVPGQFFGECIAPHAHEIRWVEHDRVLRAHALIHSELTEALDAYDEGQLELYLDDESGKPEGFVAEMADVVVRILDVFGQLGYDWTQPSSNRGLAPSVLNEHWVSRAASTRPACEIRLAGGLLHGQDVPVHLHVGTVRKHIDNATEAARINAWGEHQEHLTLALLHVAGICDGLGLDLGEAIETKMAFNKTRPHRHGGKAA